MRRDCASVKKNNVEKFMTSIGLPRKTDIENKSDQKINVIVSYQRISVKVSASGKSEVSTNFPATAGSVKLMGKHPPQESGILPHSSATFEIPWTNYYVVILTTQTDGSYVIHEKYRLVRSSQNWELRRKTFFYDRRTHYFC
jgi:hypothetical protein